MLRAIHDSRETADRTLQKIRTFHHVVRERCVGYMKCEHVRAKITDDDFCYTASGQFLFLIAPHGSICRDLFGSPPCTESTTASGTSITKTPLIPAGWRILVPGIQF
jgi:hypothetical protein